MAKLQPTTEPSFATGGYVEPPFEPLIYQDGCVLPISSMSSNDSRATLHAMNLALKAIIDNDQA